MEVIRVLLIYLVLCSSGVLVNSATNPKDVSALRSLKNDWKNTPPNWGKSNDPCDNKWDGVTCTNSRITALILISMNLEGSLSGDIASLFELVTLDLSHNPGLSGSVTSQIGNLKKLNTLVLTGCRFTGNIPTEIGNLERLIHLALNNNNFSGPIPPTLGRLSNLLWLDLAENQLTGNLPVTTDSTPGLDQLLNTKHFHFNKNQLSGPIPLTLFSAQMQLIHILFDGNQFTGSIPVTLGLVQTLEVLRLDKNTLSGAIPTSIGNLTRLHELHLANNQLSGPIPDLTKMNSLNFVDLSNNLFMPSEAPSWFSTAESLTTLVLENGNLQGSVPQKLFSFSQLQQVKLKNNQFNGTLDMGSSTSQQLQLVDLENNAIKSVPAGSGYTNALILVGNPVCSPSSSYSDSKPCGVYEKKRPYTTSLGTCNPDLCPTGQKVVPLSCACAYPYSGTLEFRAPSFKDLSNFTVLRLLERGLWENLILSPSSVILQNPFFNSDDYLLIQLFLLPSTGKYFDRSEVLRIGSYLSPSNQTYKPPKVFGPYSFIAFPYVFQAESGGGSISMGAIIGIVVGCVILILLLIGVAIYALQQKKRAEKAIELSKPFASWGPSGKDSGGAPQLKGARWFSYEDLKNCTNNFLQSNEIGSGGYGKVYRGILPNGQVIAIKRAQQGSMQGVHEFKTEIELLSRVHHRNLVGLLGFCFEQGEQMLVYEYMTNGTLRESLSGKSGIQLDWKKRLHITLDSARGLAYLHELANPPIIHRDVKSTNILLDVNLTAKVADFGLSKLVQDSEKGHVSTQVKGTLGYLDPEYYITQQLTEKSDVYSFGVVMLELITSRQPIENGKYIVREVRTIMDMTSEKNCGLTEIMDPSIRNATNLIGFGRFLELAMQCVKELAADRPTMSDLVKEIETMLQNDGLNTNSTSASSFATEFTIAKGVPRHPYNDTDLPRNEANSSNSFDYSGGYAFSAKVEPK